MKKTAITIILLCAITTVMYSYQPEINSSTVPEISAKDKADLLEFLADRGFVRVMFDLRMEEFIPESQLNKDDRG